MSKAKKESFFWTSYSDLMTSLFFIMLVLFVLTVVLLNKKMIEIKANEEATKEQLAKIEEIEQATKDINPVYFEYNEKYKKHILKINVNFPTGIANINSIDDITRQKLVEAGRAIQNLIGQKTQEFGIQYLLVIEGQASRDKWGEENNYKLSYERALSLRNFWKENKLDFGNNCEVLISGTGTGGVMREKEELKNQRFLIHIIPKPGIIEASKTK
jgi:outer membrane protein OmpA-like peptidoglycan-associated protein